MKRNIIVFLLSFMLPSIMYSQNQDIKEGVVDNDEMAVSIVQSSENVYNGIYPIIAVR